MAKIFTKKGDCGMTSLGNGLRVEKDDVRIETNGEMDELNALIGVVRSMLPKDSEEGIKLNNIQHLLMCLMSYIAFSKDLEIKDIEDALKQMEYDIEQLQGDRAFNFVAPGSSQIEAFLHLARTQARKVERRLCTVNHTYPLHPVVLKFMNRLSDYLFALAEKH